MTERPEQKQEVELRDRDAGHFLQWFIESRGAYWLSAQVGLVLQSLQLTPHKPLRIYDAGAGVGIYTLQIAKRFPDARILAVDFSPRSIEILNRTARDQHLHNVEGIVEDIATYQPEPQAYDRGICVEVLQHLPTHEYRLGATRRVYNCLKSDGIFVTTNYRWHGLIKPPTPKEETTNSGLHRHSFTEDELKSLLELAGFRIVECSGIIRMPKRIRKILPAQIAPYAEGCLNRLGWNVEDAQLVLATGRK